MTIQEHIDQHAAEIRAECARLKMPEVEELILQSAVNRWAASRTGGELAEVILRVKVFLNPDPTNPIDAALTEIYRRLEKTPARKTFPYACGSTSVPSVPSVNSVLNPNPES